MTQDARLGPKLWCVAVLLGGSLTLLWTWVDWGNLAHLQLPDTDDMARLQQVRDWLGGQAWGDLVQHRLSDGINGSFHWSRIADLGVAGWLMATGGNTLAAVILWPATLFVLFIAAAAHLAMRVGGRDCGFPAMIVAAFAFPAITMFVPGRIDHHGLQILLTLLLADAAVRPPSLRSGTIAGLATAASLAIGLETAPLIVGVMVVLAVIWLIDGDVERRRTLAFGLTLGAATLAWRILARPQLWSPTWCDGFTPASFDATMIAAALFIILGAVASRIFGSKLASRLAIGLVTGLVALGLAYHTSSVCLAGPYGPTDPVLRRLWLDHIIEVRGLFAGRGPQIPLGFGALPILCVVAAAWLAWRTRQRHWLILLSLSTIALAVTMFQVRGAAIAAALAIAPLSAVVAYVRRERRSFVIPAWLASFGLVWSLIGTSLQPGQAKVARGAGCADWQTIEQLRALPIGTFVAPIDAGAYILALTPHRVLAAPYHRNNVGNRASYDFWLSPPAQARVAAAHWKIGYVLYCADGLGDVDLKREGPGGMAELLAAGHPPAWLRPLPLRNSRAQLYRILPPAPSAP